MKTWNKPKLIELGIKETECEWKFGFMCDNPNCCYTEFHRSPTSNWYDNYTPTTCSKCNTGKMQVIGKEYMCYNNGDCLLS